MEPRDGISSSLVSNLVPNPMKTGPNWIAKPLQMISHDLMLAATHERVWRNKALMKSGFLLLGWNRSCDFSGWRDVKHYSNLVAWRKALS
jgi:hypothetical protein